MAFGDSYRDWAEKSGRYNEYKAPQRPQQPRPQQPRPQQPVTQNQPGAGGFPGTLIPLPQAQKPTGGPLQGTAIPLNQTFEQTLAKQKKPVQASWPIRPDGTPIGAPGTPGAGAVGVGAGAFAGLPVDPRDPTGTAFGRKGVPGTPISNELGIPPPAAQPPPGTAPVPQGRPTPVRAKDRRVFGANRPNQFPEPARYRAGR